MIRVWVLNLGQSPNEENDDDDDEEGEEGCGGVLPNSIAMMAELYFPYPRDIRPPITALVMSPDQKRFWSGDANGQVLSWSSYQIASK